MPFWIANLCDRLTGCWLNATLSNYCSMTFVVVGLGLVAARFRD